VGCDGPIGWLVFNNPEKHNAITPEMMAGMGKAVAVLAHDDAVRVVVMRGAGTQAFMAGGDLKRSKEWHETDESRHASEHFTHPLHNLEKPLITMIYGWCLGAGVFTAIPGDIRVAADDAQIGIPAGKIGIGLPYDEVKFLIRAIGAANAAEMIMTSARFGAVEAQRLGVVSRVVPKAELEIYVTQLAQQIAENAPLTIRAAKSTIRSIREGDGGRAACQTLIDACFASADLAEGLTAFAEKRKAQFVGR
jgi:enoyl-CoA hydratase/carnithine racemase